MKTPELIDEKSILAVGEVLLDACSNEKRLLRPWKPFDVAQVARRCIEVYEQAGARVQRDLLAALKEILADADQISYHTPHLGPDYWLKAQAAVARATKKETVA